MSLATDLRILYALALAPVHGHTHAERLESFYSRQADRYDPFRDRLLHGRRELMDRLPRPDGGTWVDMGGGTGRNLEFLGDDIHRLGRAVVIDLCPSLLRVARQRAARLDWRHVSLVQADATVPLIAPGTVDVVTFSYSLTMIPDWFAAIERAWDMLRVGGTIGIVDFHVSRKHGGPGHPAQGWAARHFWPAWFDRDNVRLSPDHLPYVQRRFETQVLTTARAPVPYLPGARIPYYVFTGTKKDEHLGASRA